MTAPVFIPIPDHVIYDASLSPDERSVLLIISAETSREGCRKKDSSLALPIGMKVAKFKKLLRSLTSSGRVIMEEGPDGRSLTVNTRPEPEKKGSEEVRAVHDLFDKRYLTVPEGQVNRLINIFFESGVNPLLVGEPTKNRFFASPFNRQGAKSLIVSYGAPLVEDVIDRLRLRKDEKFCPKVKSLWTLHEKWDSVNRFLTNDWKTPKSKVFTSTK